MNNRTARTTACLLPLVGALCVALPAQAQGMSCEQRRDDIATRIKLPKDSYRLEIVAESEASTGKRMGSCDGGARKIVFVTGEAAAPIEAKPAPTPQPDPETKPAPQTDPAPSPTPVADDHPALTKYRWSADKETVKQYLAWIAEARAKHPYDDAEDRMIFMMHCESRGVAGVVSDNKRYTGLFQYNAAMWAESWNDYSHLGIKDAYAQIFATAKAWSLKKQTRWGADCYPRNATVAKN